MKQLVCEMCGSKDFVKQDGLFSCQVCGCKYTVEEAKKMMIEGTVDIQGTVKVDNADSVGNLLKLAQSSYDSKNYAQAENFCNEILAMDSQNYEAWKLKGEAINYQITVSNDRIDEVYNCIMTSYSVLNDAGKDAHRDEVLASLRVCLEGEIDFVFDAFAKDCGDAMLEKVKNTFVKCGSKVLDSYKALGYSEEEAEEYRVYIVNYVIEKANESTASIWDDSVWPNYYRGGFNDEYHPSAEILSNYLGEGSNLIELLNYLEEFFSDDVPLKEQRENYRLQKFYHSKLIAGKSYVRMVETTTNGYGAVTNRREYWKEDKVPSADAIAYRKKEITRLTNLFDQTEQKMAEQDPEVRQKFMAQWTKERDSLDLHPKAENGCFVWGFLIIGAICMYLTFGGPLNYEEFWQIFVGIFGGVLLLAAPIGWLIERSNAKKKGKENQARFAHLNQKIEALKNIQ